MAAETTTTPVEGTIGYYRFTDIFFEWCKVLPNMDDVRPLKALIDYNALVNEKHPLRLPGVNGIQLYRGTFENGEMRLLFSSAQVEYIRYWLHAVQLTKEPIPIPCSEYLLQSSELHSCSPDVYADALTLKRAIKVRSRGSRGGRRRGHRGGTRTRRRKPSTNVNWALPNVDPSQNIEKDNKRLKGVGSLLGARRLVFERVRTLWAAKLGTWIAMDFEAWDRDHTVLTEFGWKTIRWIDQQPQPETDQGHLVVHEHRKYSQYYVPDNREHYSFGDSEDVSKAQFKERICAMIEKAKSQGPLYLVFHDHSQDLKYLKSDSINALERTDVLSDNPRTGEVYVVDTAELFAALEGESSGNTRSLERVCRHLQISTQFLHNAGNDAYYTLDAMVAMASGSPLDEQRKQRWPEHTNDQQPRVDLPEEADSDLSDMEGIFGTGVPLNTQDSNNDDIEV